MNQHFSRRSQLFVSLFVILCCTVLFTLQHTNTNTHTETDRDKNQLTQSRPKNQDGASMDFVVSSSSGDNDEPSPSPSAVQAQLQVQTMLNNLTVDSLVHYHSREAKSVDAHRSMMKVPLTPDPLPLLMAEYAWRDFAAHDNKTTLYSTTCPITCQVQVEPALEQNTPWTIKTFDIAGLPKTVGGDEFMVLYYNTEADDTTNNNYVDAAARIQDRRDGSYTLEFFKTPNGMKKDAMKGIGTLVIWLVFSCDLGMVPPPTKKSWNTGAFAMTRYEIHNISSAPYLHDFEPPNANHAIDLGQYDKILVHGDSTMNHFAGNFPGVSGFPSNLMMWNGGNRHALYVSMVNHVMKLVRDHMKWMVGTFEKVAFVFGSSAWDINIDPDGLHGSDFSNQIEASRLLMETMRQEFPTVHLYWRSGVAMHPHLSTLNKGKWYGDERNKYMSDGRVRYLYHLQKELMQNLSVTFLDMYPASFLCMDYHDTGKSPGDAVHYTRDWNRVMTRWFYPNETTGGYIKEKVPGR